MMKNKPLILAALTIILLAYFVIAAAEGVRIVSPLQGANYTNFTNVIFNVSYTNITDITNPLNATFFLNISGVWTTIGNTSSCTSNACFATLSNSTISDGVYSLNATIRNGSTSISVSYLTNLSNIIYVDRTPPAIFSENYSSVISFGNYSQNKAITILAIDATTGVQSVVFNITNSAGVQNASLTTTKDGSTYSVTTNTSHYPDGAYNITAYVNDSLGNLNSSARIQVTFDNTVPVATFTCDDYTVDEDDVMDCNCVYSDALSGIASASFDSSPSTSNSGNNQQSSCTVTDRAGNVNVSTISYNVTGISGGSSSGSSGSSSSGTSSGSSSSGSSSSSNNTSGNTTTQNQSSGSANLLEGNQEDQTEKEFKLNYWIIGAVILVAGLGITVAVLIKKGILQRLLKFNK
ncbi:MAG: hypothetical protein ACP5N7_04645 [Candidatus Pacearchaeota archaeon]